MNLVKFRVVGVMTLASLLICLAILHAGREKSEHRDTELAAQSEQIKALTADNARLAKESPAPDAPEVATTNELQTLRAEVRSLQQQVAAAQQQASAASQATAANAKSPVHHAEEYWRQLHAMANDSVGQAMKLALVLMEYESDHGGQFPASFDQVSHYLQEQKVGPGVTSEFEIIYTGTMDKVKNLPNMEVPLVRQRQAWPGPDGTQMERVYGFMGGMGMIVESDDNFQSWEAAHLINAADTSVSNP